MNDDTIMWFGSHKGKTLIDIEDSWFIWFWGENKKPYEAGRLSEESHELMDYIKDNFEEKDLIVL